MSLGVVVVGGAVMWDALGGTFGVAMGLALSPLAIVTALVLVLGERGRVRTLTFAVGWYAAMFLMTGVTAWITDTADDEVSPETKGDGIDLLHLLFGILFFALAILTWIKRPHPTNGTETVVESRGEELLQEALDLEPDDWESGGDGSDADESARDGSAKDGRPSPLERINHLGVLGCLVIGLGQGLLIVKNIPLGISAGTKLGSVGLNTSDTVIAVALFAAVASLGALIPLVVLVLGGSGVEQSLRNGLEWFKVNMTAVTLVVLILLGGVFLGEGLGLAG